MMERSLSQERAYWDERIGMAMRNVQECTETAEEYRKLHDRIHSVEPLSPIAGKVQRHILDVCKDMQHKSLYQANENQQAVENLKEGRP